MTPEQEARRDEERAQRAAAGRKVYILRDIRRCMKEVLQMQRRVPGS